MERRLAAHEAVLDCAMDMRMMTTSGDIDEDWEVIRVPSVLIDRDSFRAFFDKFGNIGKQASAWLSLDVKKEFNFAQDYIVSIGVNLRKMSDEHLHEFGAIIAPDLVSISSSLEQKIYKYFADKIVDIRLDDVGEWHKYEQEESRRRFAELNYIQKEDKIRELMK